MFCFSDGVNGSEIQDNSRYFLPGLVCGWLYDSRPCCLLRSKPRAPATLPRSRLHLVPLVLVVSKCCAGTSTLSDVMSTGCRLLPESARWLMAEGKQVRGWQEIRRIARMNGTTHKLGDQQKFNSAAEEETAFVTVS